MDRIRSIEPSFGGILEYDAKTPDTLSYFWQKEWYVADIHGTGWLKNIAADFDDSLSPIAVPIKMTIHENFICVVFHKRTKDNNVDWSICITFTKDKSLCILGDNLPQPLGAANPSKKKNKKNKKNKNLPIGYEDWMKPPPNEPINPELALFKDIVRNLRADVTSLLVKCDDVKKENTKLRDSVSALRVTNTNLINTISQFEQRIMRLEAMIIMNPASYSVLPNLYT